MLKNDQGYPLFPEELSYSELVTLRDDLVRYETQQHVCGSSGFGIGCDGWSDTCLPCYISSVERCIDKKLNM